MSIMEKVFSQGYNLDDGTYYFELQQWEPTASVLWSVKKDWIVLRVWMLF